MFPSPVLDRSLLFCEGSALQKTGILLNALSVFVHMSGGLFLWLFHLPHPSHKWLCNILPLALKMMREWARGCGRGWNNLRGFLRLRWVCGGKGPFGVVLGAISQPHTLGFSGKFKIFWRGKRICCCARSRFVGVTPKEETSGCDKIPPSPVERGHVRED